MDQKEILFSVPTICDSTPATDPKKGSSSECNIHEDDWRQIEFVAKSNLTYIQHELEVVSSFKQQNRRGP
ncbi:MAG: hypothetical protein ACRD36_02285, partial [Candidatus Acidiferrum sp.]